MHSPVYSRPRPAASPKPSCGRENSPPRPADNRPRGLTRDEIFRPGGFVSLPKALAADPALPPTAKLAFAALADHLRDGAELCWPSIPRIARMIGASRRAAQLAIRDLAAAGWIVLNGSPGRATRYELRNPVGFCAPTCAKSDPVAAPDQRRYCAGPGQILRRTRPDFAPEERKEEPEGRTEDLVCCANGGNSPETRPEVGGGAGRRADSEAERRRREARAGLDAFRSLPPAAQAPWLDQAAATRPAPKTAGRIEAVAAALWDRAGRAADVA